MSASELIRVESRFFWTGLPFMQIVKNDPETDHIVQHAKQSAAAWVSLSFYPYKFAPVSAPKKHLLLLAGAGQVK